jgi:GNAT superfamily N-acetyltransferase
MKKKFVQNNGIYWNFIRELRNHPQIKLGFTQQKHISEKEHYRFMEKYGLHYFICLIDGVPAGYVGVVNNDIRVATHPDYQGMGIGKYMIEELSKRHPNAFAKVKLENKTSIKLFESCGFKKKYYIFERSTVRFYTQKD